MMRMCMAVRAGAGARPGLNLHACVSAAAALVLLVDAAGGMDTYPTSFRAHDAHAVR